MLYSMFPNRFSSIMFQHHFRMEFFLLFTDNSITADCFKSISSGMCSKEMNILKNANTMCGDIISFNPFEMFLLRKNFKSNSSMVIKMFEWKDCDKQRNICEIEERIVHIQYLYYSLFISIVCVVCADIGGAEI